MENCISRTVVLARLIDGIEAGTITAAGDNANSRSHVMLAKG